MARSYGSLCGVILRSALPREEKITLAVMVSMLDDIEAPTLDRTREDVAYSVGYRDRRPASRAIDELVRLGLVRLTAGGFEFELEAIDGLERLDGWGRVPKTHAPKTHAHTKMVRTCQNSTCQNGTQPRAKMVRDESKNGTPYSLYVPNSDPQSDPPLPPTPHGQDEEEEEEGQGELLTFPGDDTPLPTDADLALWGELAEAHTVDFFADSEPATVARPAAISKPAQIEDPFVTAAREAPIKESSPAARELRAKLERILAPSIGRQQRGGLTLDSLTALSVDDLISKLTATGQTEEAALETIIARLPEAGTKTSPLGWLRTVLLSPPRTAQEARNGGDRYPRQGGVGYGAQESARPSMKPLTDADLSPRARWFQDHYGCLMDLRTYPLDFPFMSDSDRAVLEQFHADLKSGKIREEDIP